MAAEILRYEADRATPLPIPALDPHGIMRIDVIVEDWLNGDTLADHAWIVSSPLVLGNGVLQKLLRTGNSKTPPASAVGTDTDTGKQAITAYVWLDDAATARLGTEFVIELALETPTRGDERSFSFPLKNR